MKIIEQKVIKFIKDNNLIQPGDKILVALSGGPDSIFLIHFLLKFLKKYKIEIAAAHINHLLRGNEADADEKFCKDYCKSKSIKYFSSKINAADYAKKNKLSVEVAGRNIRYKFFEDVLKQNGFNKIATAHHANDNSETVLLNLLKGTGLRGISGIPVKRNNIIRPVLCVTKEEILKYLGGEQISFRLDASNETDEYERNYLRNQIFPGLINNINPVVHSSILSSSRNFQDLKDFVDEEIKGLKNECSSKKNEFIRIPASLMQSANKFLFSELLIKLVMENFNNQITSMELLKVFSLLNKQKGSTEELKNNLLLSREKNHLEIRKIKNKKVIPLLKAGLGETVIQNGKKLIIEVVNKETINFTKSSKVEYIDAAKVAGDFTVTNWRAGDRFYPIGFNGTKKISNYLNEIDLTSFEKKQQLLLLNKNKIVWVIGKRLDDRFKITKDTKKVLMLCLK